MDPSQLLLLLLLLQLHHSSFVHFFCMNELTWNVNKNNNVNCKDISTNSLFHFSTFSFYVAAHIIFVFKICYAIIKFAFDVLKWSGSTLWMHILHSMIFFFEKLTKIFSISRVITFQIPIHHIHGYYAFRIEFFIRIFFLLEIFASVRDSFINLLAIID